MGAFKEEAGQLTQLELAQFSLKIEKLNRAEAKKELEELRFRNAIAPNPALTKMYTELRKANVTYGKAARVYNNLRESIAERFGLTVGKYSVDDETGIIYNLDQNKSVAPAVTKKKSPTKKRTAKKKTKSKPKPRSKPKAR